VSLEKELGVSEEWLDLAVMGVGAGAKATIEDWVATTFPQIPTEYAGIIAGFLLFKFGERIHHLVRVAGAGVLIGSIGQLDIVKGIFEKPAGASPTGSSPQAQTLGDLARMASQQRVVSA